MRRFGSVAFSSDSRSVLAGNWDGEVRARDAEGDEEARAHCCNHVVEHPVVFVKDDYQRNDKQRIITVV